MPKKTYALTDPGGAPYSEEQVRELLHLRDPGTLPRWRKEGTAPPFFRKGRKHSRILYPRGPFWTWFLEHTFENADEADRKAS